MSTSDDAVRQHAENMRVAQSRIHAGDARYYIETANGYVVRGPFLAGPEGREQAEQALEQRRQWAQENYE